MSLSKTLLRMARFGKTILPAPKKNSPKRSNFKQFLQLDSTFQEQTLSGKLSDTTVTVEALLVRDRLLNEVIALPNTHSSGGHQFSFSLTHDILPALVNRVLENQELTEQEQPLLLKEAEDTLESLETDASDDTTEEETELPSGRFSLWLKFSKSVTDFQPATLEKWETNGLPNHATIIDDLFTREIILGRFSETRIAAPLKPLLDADFQHVAHLYTDLKGNLRLLLNKEPKVKPKMQIDAIDSPVADQTEIKGKIFTRHAFIRKGTLQLVHRETGEQIPVPIDWVYDNARSAEKFGLYRYTYRTVINWTRLHQEHQLLQEGIYDAFVALDYYHRSAPTLLRLGRARYITRQLTPETRGQGDATTMHIIPYFTVGHRNLSFEMTEFTNDNYAYLNHMMKFAPLYRLFAEKNTWLVGERPYKAQDNGYHFFKYMRETYPDRPVYYVIDPESNEYSQVEQLGHALPFKSKEHIYHSLMSKKVIGTHHAEYLYPLRSEAFKRKMKADRVFIQHGVLGTKNMDDQYGKFAPAFDTDLFLVSSEREKRLVTQDMGYPEREVRITGLSRFDALLAKDVEVKRQMLIIPTWRSWLQTPLQFFESEYYQQYQTLLTSERLHRFADEHQLEIVFCLHPNMQQYTSHFEDLPITVIHQGERDVQGLMKESLLLVTDYSSVAFDFSFLNRPVHYFQFDPVRFIGPKGSYLDLEQELPGPISSTLDELFNDLDATAARSFAMAPEYQARAAAFLQPVESSYSEKILQTIVDFKKERNWIEQIQTAEAANILFRLYRRSRFYFPSMKLAYRLMQRLPVDPKLVVFESGLGKQYSDSPRYIYEELKRRDLDYKVVWVYHKRLYLGDPNAKVIKRLSPAYFYYLATAKFWVNNQNFPHYFTRRKETTYIQTWHGTPLKKMLFDLDEIHGRDEGYIDRVTNSIKQWSVLLSPSAYASTIFKSAFRYDGPIFESGYPRNDLFFSNNQPKTIESIRTKLQLSDDKKVILYAPTFRDHQSLGNGKFFFDYPFDFNRVAEALGDEYVFLIRTHVLVTKKPRIPAEHRERFIDVTSYPDIQELYLITDLLITDYSSVFFDFANMNRPMFFYAYDLDLYRDTLRGFYLDYYKDLPGPILETEDAFIEALANIPQLTNDYQSRLDSFREAYCAMEDGSAASRVVDSYFAKDTLELTEQSDGSYSV
ncbi:CDP-glycerol glycerophosphotransferase family protein [Exiguobacterium sp. R-39]|uniref:CDP-glycerol glycerophosphotransferase family protein n=1 Tax=Exiguobacterium sp. R-39 TaxID=3416708 RepID=UPI003CEC4285